MHNTYMKADMYIYTDTAMDLYKGTCRVCT